MSINLNDPHNLRALLATMKSAKEKRVNMAIWDQDIKAVEDAIATIEAIRGLQRIPQETEHTERMRGYAKVIRDNPETDEEKAITVLVGNSLRPGVAVPEKNK